MRYHALALDYDGSIAHGGKVAPQFVEALKKVKASGRTTDTFANMQRAILAKKEASTSKDPMESSI